MGSYLTLINNSELTYECKVGYHEAALQGSLYAAFLLGAVTGATRVVGWLKMISLGALIFGVGFFTIQLTALYGPKKQLKSIRATMEQFDYFSESSVASINIELGKKGFFTIKPQESHQYGKMSLGLLRQATCVRTVYLTNVTLDMQVLLIRPISSGLLPNRNRNYNIKAAMEKTGTQHYMVYSARFMEYENKTFSAQPVFPTTAGQQPLIMPIQNTQGTSPGSNLSETANVSLLNNYQPIRSVSTYSQGNDGSSADNGTPQAATKSQYEPVPSSNVPRAFYTGNSGAMFPTNVSISQPLTQPIQSVA